MFYFLINKDANNKVNFVSDNSKETIFNRMQQWRFLRPNGGGGGEGGLGQRKALF